MHVRAARPAGFAKRDSLRSDAVRLPLRRPNLFTNCTPDADAGAALASGCADKTDMTDLAPLIKRIHASPTRLVMLLTGGAVHAPTWLLSVPGASRTILDVRIPYSHESLADIVPRDISDRHPSVSVEMAVAMAKEAFREATNLTPFGTEVLGVGVTCALATDRERRGEDKVIVCTKDSRGQIVRAGLLFDKGILSRLEQDQEASTLVIGEIATGCGLVDTDELKDSCIIESGCLNVRDAVDRLLKGSAQTVEFSGGHVFTDAPRRNRLYLPGSFNPLHDGHKQLLKAAEEQYIQKREAAFELSVENADKGLLDAEEIVQRVAQFTEAGLPVVLTRAPLFTMKSELFPDSTFIVGHDTAIRLVQEKYYGGSDAEMLKQFAMLENKGCNFLVAGRLDKKSNTYYSLKDVNIPAILAGMKLFSALDEGAFRVDISSTELRERMARGKPNSS
jgi:nicotinic acid mononucleotide adenylyltransferase